MSRGFITIGIDTDTDKVKNNYVLALSLKACDPTAEICIVVEKSQSDAIAKKYGSAFDYIVELPFGNTGYADGFHGSNIWQILHCTPFEETIYLDYDTFLLDVDIPLLWDKFKNYDIAMPVSARTYRNHIINKMHMFETEIAYQLPTFHNELIYFKTGSKLAVEWFKLADPIFQNWRESYNVFFKEKKPQTFNKNILCNLVTGNLDCYQEVGIFLNNYYDLHTKGQYFWNEDVPVELTELLNTWYSSKYGMFIENSLINSGIIHFRDENLITEEIRNDFKSIVDYKEATSQTT